MANRDLLKEAIADAKALKETAIANAKAALEEAFEPRLKSMLSAKLEEMEKEDMDEGYDEVAEEKNSKEEMKEETSEPHGNIGAQTPEGEPLGFLEEEDMDEEMNLDEILAELEEGEDKEDMKEAKEDIDEAKDEMDEAEDMYEAEEDDEDKDDAKEGEDEDEEIDLEEMTEEDLKNFIEDVIADMVEAGELEAGEGMEDEEGSEEEMDIEIDAEDDSEELMESKEEMDEGLFDFLKKKKAEAPVKKNDPNPIIGVDYDGNYIRQDGTMAEGYGKSEMDEATLNEEPVSAMAIAAGMASILGGSALLAKVQDKMEKGDFGAKGKKVADFLQKVSKGATAATQNLEEKDDMEEMMEEINALKSELHEVNLLNAKLLYTNKIFRAKNLKEAQKVKVLEAFDRAETVSEVKLVFETLSGEVKENKTIVKENLGRASKAAGMAPTKSPIVDVDPQVARWQKLAGIK
jgi:hypothetical protein